MWGNTVAIHNVLKKKTTKLNYQSAQYEKNKINIYNSGKKKKNHVGKHCSNSQCFKEKNTKLNFQPAPY